MQNVPLMAINGPIGQQDKVGFLATIIGPTLREDHPLPWRIEDVPEGCKILDKDNQLVMLCENRIQAKRFIAHIDENSDERRDELEYELNNAHFQADWVEQHGGLHALLYGVPSLRR
jgi:hypothetical protein